MKILAVEDDPSAAMVIESVLRYLGHEVILATTADEAFARVKAEPIRIVVSDWLLGRADGLDLCRRIRQTSLDYVYFILLTQREASDENEQLAMVAGVDDFLTKPLDLLELRMRLRVAERILRYTTQVRQLEELLPICSYCKKIRDDQNYWQQMEGYINERTGSEFSHSVCPDCYTRVIIPELEQIKASASAPLKPHVCE